MAAGRQYWRPLPQDAAALLLQPPTVPSWRDESQPDPSRGPTASYVERYGEYLAAYEQFLLARVVMRDLEMRTTARDPSRASSVAVTHEVGQDPLWPSSTRPRLGMEEVRVGAPSSAPFPPPVSYAGHARPSPGLTPRPAAATPPKGVASGPSAQTDEGAKPSEAQLARRRAKRRRNRLSARTRRAVARTEAIKAQTGQVKAEKTLEQLRRPPRSKPAKAETGADAPAVKARHRSPSYLRRLERRKQLRTGSS